MTPTDPAEDESQELRGRNGRQLWRLPFYDAFASTMDTRDESGQASGRVTLLSVSFQFVVDRDCAKAGLLLSIGGLDADCCELGQC